MSMTPNDRRNELSREQMVYNVNSLARRNYEGPDARVKLVDALSRHDTALRARLKLQTIQRQQDAVDGQSAMDLLTGQVVCLTRERDAHKEIAEQAPSLRADIEQLEQKLAEAQATIGELAAERDAWKKIATASGKEAT